MNTNNRLILIIAICGFVLLVPLIAMQFSSEVNWALGDFIVAAVLLFGTALLFEFILRKVKKPNHRVIICLVVLIILALIWAELAVGIFGSPFAGN